MVKRTNLRSQNVTKRRRQVNSYGTQTPLSSAAVERGSTRWLNGSTVVIEGLLDVTGRALVSGLLDVTGTLNASGQINLSGSTSVTGPLDITGATTTGGSLDVTGPTNLDGVLTINGDTTITGLLAVDGPTTISGTLDIEGATTVAADFEIIAGGLFKSGVTKIEPTGKATFGTFIIDPSSNKLIQAPGGWLFSDGSDSIGLAGSSTSSVNLNSSRAELVYASSSRVVARSGAIDLTAAAIHATGRYLVDGGTGSGGVEVSYNRLKIGSLPTSSLVTANVHVDSNGIFYRVNP